MSNDADFVDLSAVNPLDCTECKSEMKDPVRLSCQHAFCKPCLDSKSNCPVCGIDFCPSKLTTDRILNYLIESSHELVEVCGNCDKQSQPMSFCNTCQQPLCDSCVTITHSAKFFASHNITPLDERGRLRGNLICTDHNAPFVLYCQENRRLMCIECFNASSSERRNHFINIEQAHKTCREKLDKSVIRLRSFQNELKEQCEVQARLLSEMEAKFTLAEERLLQKYQQIIDTLSKKKDELIEEIHTKREKQAHQIQRQITALVNMEILNILPNSEQRVEAIGQMEVGRSVMRENEKLAADRETQALKKNLKETKRNQRPISMIVIEGNRDRDDTISPGVSQKLQKKRQKRTSQSDEASSVCSVSPRTLSSTVSLDINTTEIPSPNSLSPLPTKRAESVAELVTPVTPPPAPKTPPVSPAQTPSETSKESVPKFPIPVSASDATVNARNLLIQSIKEKVKRID